MVGPRRSNHPGKRHPLSDEMYNARLALGETQEKFAKRFPVTRTTYLGWELYHPPNHAGLQAWIAATVAKAKRDATKRKLHKERRESTWTS